MSLDFFCPRPRITPTIYAYELIGVSSHKDYLKIGYTERDVETRVDEQMHTSAVPYRIVLKESAMRPDGSCFTDHDVHAVLKQNGYRQLNDGEDRNEWFRCDIDAVKAAIIAVRDGTANIENRTQTFKMRPEHDSRSVLCLQCSNCWTNCHRCPFNVFSPIHVPT